MLVIICNVMLTGGGSGGAFRGHGSPYICNNFFYMLQLTRLKILKFLVRYVLGDGPPVNLINM